MSNKNIDIFINKSTTMRGYMTISDEEKNSILQRHSSFYNGYAVGNVPSGPQPLTVGKGASDPNGVTVDNKGIVKTYQNHNINESIVSEEEMMEQGCADTKKGCIRKRKEGWVILNNKKGGVWRKCNSKEHCEEMLQAMHVSEEVNEIQASDMDISDEEAAYAFKSGGPEQFDSSYSDDSYGMDIDSIMDMFGGDMSPAEYDDMEGMMDSDMDGKEKFHDEDDAYEFDSQGGNADVYYEEKEQCEGCGSKMNEAKEVCEQCGGEMKEGECMECGALYEEIDEDLHESFKEQRMKINEMFNRFSKFN